MSFNRHLFSSATGEWETPQSLYNTLNQEFGFTLDACASAQNAKTGCYYAEASLEQQWRGIVWCNPPYGRRIAAWVKKGRKAAMEGATVVMLLPSRTDTQWWHDDVMKATEIRFIRGRLKFGDAKSGAPFPSAIVVFAKGQSDISFPKGTQDFGT